LFAGQGKLMIFGLGIGILSLVGLAFILVAPQSTDPLSNYVIGGAILVVGVGGSVSYYAYNWTIALTKWRALGMLLRPGWGRPTGEIWSLNQPIIELLREVVNKKGGEESTDKTKLKKKKEKDPDNPQIETVVSEIDVNRLETMIPDETKKKVEKDGGKFHYYLVPHVGDTTGRDALITVNPIEGMFEYFPEEVMINDFPRRVNIAFGTGSLIGQHDVYLPKLIPKGWKRISRLFDLFKDKALYDSVKVWLVIDSNLHGWRVKYQMDLESPDREKAKEAIGMITTIDSADYIEENKMLKHKLERLEEKLLEKIMFEATYSEKNIYKGSEDSVLKRIQDVAKGPFWNIKNIILIVTLFILLLTLIYLIFYQGAFSLQSDNTQRPGGNETIPVIGGGIINWLINKKKE
jgi:hypothetical protein